MIGLKGYIKEKFSNSSNFVDDMMEGISVDRRRTDSIHGAGIWFDVANRVIEGDFPIHEDKAEDLQMSLENSGINIDDTHTHNEYKHIHFSCPLSKQAIDKLEEFLNKL
jgi:hypothetical protein